MERFDDDAEFAQVVAPDVLDEFGVVLALDPDAARRGDASPSVAGTEPEAVTRCVAAADAAGRTSVTGRPSIRKPPGFQVKCRM